MYIFAGILIYNFIKGTFEYEKVTRLRMIIVPIYSALMMFLSLKKLHLEDLKIALILFIIGIVIGLFTASQTKIKDENKVDKWGRPILKVRRGWPYLIGWIITFAIGIGVEIFFGADVNVADVSHELFEELLKDFTVLAIIGGHSAWFVWVLNVATSFSYGISLLKRYPKIRQAIRAKKVY